MKKPVILQIPSGANIAFLCAGIVLGATIILLANNKVKTGEAVKEVAKVVGTFAAAA